MLHILVGLQKINFCGVPKMAALSLLASRKKKCVRAQTSRSIANAVALKPQLLFFLLILVKNKTSMKHIITQRFILK